MNRALLLALALVLALAAAVLPRRSPDDLATRRAAELLDLPVQTSGPAVEAQAPAPSLWRALLSSSAFERTNAGPVLRLGWVAADPTVAQLAARQARELLELPCTVAGEKMPLWQAVLASPAAVHDERGTTLRLYGVRLLTDAAAFPDVDHHYEARLSLAHGLEELARSAAPGEPFTLAGELEPVHGGANFLVLQEGERQALELTIDRANFPSLRVERTGRPEAPNDATLRLVLVRGLLSRAASDPAFANLDIEGEEAPASGGPTVRFSRIGDEEVLVVTPIGGAPMRVARPWTEPEAIAQVLSPERVALAGAALVLAGMALVPRAGRRRATPAAPAAPQGGVSATPAG
jgi:hypothetical protein